MAGNTVVPLPSSGNSNTWSPNITQLGTGSNQITINGGTGTINATSLQEGGVDIDTKFQPIFWIWVIIPSSSTNGAVSITTYAGQVSSVSCSRSATGTYVLSWTPSIGTSTYFVNGNVRNAGGFVSFSGTTATACNILTYNASGTLTDIASGCHVMILKF